MTISEVLQKVEKADNEAEKVQLLLRNDGFALRAVLKHTYDPDIKFLLPDGAPPFKKSEAVESVNMLQHEAKKLHIFVEGGPYPNMNSTKREMLFIQLLEVVEPNDAKLLIDMKDKHLPDYPSVTPELVLKAFPGMFRYVEAIQAEFEEIPAGEPENPATEDVLDDDLLDENDDEDLVDVPEMMNPDKPPVKQEKPKKQVQLQELTCPHCGHVGKAPSIYRFHFDKCKEKK